MNVSLTIDGIIAWLRLERAQHKNAITLSMWKRIAELARQVNRSHARVMVLPGEDRCFCAGADLHELTMLKSLEEARSYWVGMKSALNAIAEIQIPTIAMIEQFCLGGGCILALTCDLRYATKDSAFSIPVAKYGFMLDSATVARLSSLIGPSRTKELIFRADTISGEQALLIGLVNQTFEAEQIRPQVEKIADSICASSDLSLRQIKAQLNRNLQTSDVESGKDEELLMAQFISNK